MENSNTKRNFIRQMSLWDQETGELVASYTVNKGSKLGQGWITVYKEQMNQLLESDCPPSTLKIFMKLCCMQSYDAHIFASRAYLQEVLHITRKTLWSGLTWLIQHNYVMEEKVNGQTTFIINPNISNCGRSAIAEKEKKFEAKKARQLEFSGNVARLSLTGFNAHS